MILVESSQTSRKGGNVGNVNRRKLGNGRNCRARLYNGNGREKRLVNGARLKWRERGENSDRIGRRARYFAYMYIRAAVPLLLHVFMKSSLEMSPVIVNKIL